MEVKELRINNWFNLNGKDFYIDLKMLYAISSGNPDYDLQKINPIPINKEWLEKFGFKKTRFSRWENYNLITYGYGFMFGEWDKVILSMDESSEIFVHDVQYVHQLQNLYFALTGNELTLTPAK